LDVKNTAPDEPRTRLLLEEVYRRHKRSIVRLLRRHVVSDEVAENLFHEACRVALERLRSKGLADADRLPGFLYGTARRLAMADRRRALRRRTESDAAAIESFADPVADPDGAKEDSQLATLVRRLLDELPVERDRHVLVRLYLEERDREDICAEFGLTDEHLSRVLFRAKTRFREILERHGLQSLGSLLGLLLLASVVLIVSAG
jgi:RNA polymerase sigma-70 factor, ECF subfamily